MSAPPKAPALTREDLPDLPDKLLSPLNTWMPAVSTCLGALTLGDNLIAQAEEVIADTRSDPFPLYLANKMPRKARHLIITHCENLDSDDTAPTAAPWLTWKHVSDGRIALTGALGLAASTRYRLTLLFLP